MKPLKDNQIYLVYQDCSMCGARKNWGEIQTKVAETHGFEIIEVPFTSEGAREIIKDVCLTHKLKPKKKGSMATLPFFTDLKHFSKNLADFCEQPKPKRNKKMRTENNENME